jgi:hypothetical protein
MNKVNEAIKLANDGLDRHRVSNHLMCTCGGCVIFRKIIQTLRGQ